VCVREVLCEDVYGTPLHTAMDRMSQEFWFAHNKSKRFLSLKAPKTTPAVTYEPVRWMTATGF